MRTKTSSSRHTALPAPERCDRRRRIGGVVARRVRIIRRQGVVTTADDTFVRARNDGTVLCDQRRQCNRHDRELPLGTILVDSKGMTVYTLTNNGQAVACTGQCLTFWPPLLVASGGTTAVSAAGVKDLGTAMESSGTQVTYNGDPLYRFSMDKAPGDTNGEGVSAFGGVWHVVKVSGTTATTSPAAAVPATVTPTTAGSGYGY